MSLQDPDGRVRVRIGLNQDGSAGLAVGDKDGKAIDRSDPWGGACNDFDLYLLSQDGGLQDASENVQDCTPASQPFEMVSVAANGYPFSLAVHRVRGAGPPPTIELLSFENDLLYQVPANSMLQPRWI